MESFLKRHLNDDHCFLCGAQLSGGNRSDEHVIPRWLQEMHDLSDKRLGLLNNTFIPYRQLFIPCCVPCNNGPLSRMENEVSQFLSGDFRKPSAEEEFRLFQWCSKILYGLLHREMLLLLNRSDRSAGSIVGREFLEELTTFHHFMTSIRRPFHFVDFKPYSLFVVETLLFDDPPRNFDYFDFVALGQKDEFAVVLVLAIRTQHFGVICVPNDNGNQKEHFQDQYDRFDGIPLHPIQFLEFACKTAYKHSLISFDPKYHSIAHESPDSEVTVLQATFPRGEIWTDWDNRMYAHLFCSIAERSGFVVPPPDRFYLGDKHHTWLQDPDGKPLKMTQKDEQMIP